MRSIKSGIFDKTDKNICIYQRKSVILRYTAFALYEGGLIDILTLISDLKTYKLVDQYLFHTEQSLKALKFIEAGEIKL